MKFGLPEFSSTTQWGKSLTSSLYLTDDSIRIPWRTSHPKCNRRNRSMIQNMTSPFSPIIKTPRLPLHLSTKKKITMSFRAIPRLCSLRTNRWVHSSSETKNVCCVSVCFTLPKKRSQKHDKAQSTNTMFQIQITNKKWSFINFAMMLERCNPPELTCFNRFFCCEDSINKLTGILWVRSTNHVWVASWREAWIANVAADHGREPSVHQLQV